MDRQENETAPGRRTAGIILTTLAVASLGLLANHPSGAAHSFAEMLQEEAANRVSDGVVHGGFIVVLGGELACVAALFARRAIRPWAAGALVLLGIGAGLLMLSMLLDGLVTPAIAARYLEAPDKQEGARVVFVLLGTLIRFLMPAGLLFQAAGIAVAALGGWGKSTLARAMSVLGLLVALTAIASVAATAGVGPHAVMISILGFAAWYATTGVAAALGRL